MNLWVRTSGGLPGTAAAMATVPTGFSGVPPPGPAMPVIATAVSTPVARNTPSSIARATGSLTAPYSSSIDCGTPRSRILTPLSYATIAP